MDVVDERPLAFSPTPRLRRLALMAAVAIGAAVVTAHGRLAVVAVPALVLIVLSPRAGLPSAVGVTCRLDPSRCVEEDEVSLIVEVAAPGSGHPKDRRLSVSTRLPPHTAARLEHHSETADGAAARWVLVPRHWGRYRVGPARLIVNAGNGLYSAEVAVAVPDLVVYPGASTVSRSVTPRELPARLGEHASRSIGSGIEFAGIRPYAVGDRRRDISWRASARQQGLFVRQYAAERSFTLVLMLDVAVEAGPPGRSSLDLAVRAATGLAQTYLGLHDRVGVVSLGGSLRWLAPGAGPRQLHRIAESVMQVRLDESQVGGGIERLPPSVLPRNAFVCLLSPLLDDRGLGAARQLRERGFNLLVVDVLNSEPDIARSVGSGPLALRVWRMERTAVRAELALLGVPVLDWDGSGDLSGAFRHAMQAMPGHPGSRQ